MPRIGFERFLFYCFMLKPVITAVFWSDYDSLDSSVQAIVQKRIDKIIGAPHGGKELRGMPGLYRERLLNLRIIYQLRGNEIWFLKLKKREHAYD